MSTVTASSHRRCTNSQESAPSLFDEEARKPHAAPKHQTIGVNGRRIDGRKRGTRREGERRERGQDEAGREEGRRGEGRNESREAKGGARAAWWEKLLCCTDTDVNQPTATPIEIQPNAHKKIQAFNSEDSCIIERKSLHGTPKEGRRRSKSPRNAPARERRGPRTPTKDQERQKGSEAESRYPDFHDLGEDKEQRVPRPPQTDKPKRRRNNRNFSSRGQRNTLRPQSEVFFDVRTEVQDESNATQRCRHDEKTRKGDKKRVGQKIEGIQNSSGASTINIIFKLPSKMFNPCCRSSKYFPTVPSCHTNLTRSELDYIKLCVAAEEAIGKPLPCASNRKIYDYWMNKYGIALTGLLLSDSSDFETTDEEEGSQQKRKITEVKEGTASAFTDLDRSRPHSRTGSQKDVKLPPSGKTLSDDEKKTEVTSQQTEDAQPSKSKRGHQQRLILTRQNVSQISICSETVRDGGSEEGKIQMKQSALPQIEVKSSNQDELVSSFVRSVTGCLDRLSPVKGQTSRPDCSECFKRANSTRDLMGDSSVTTKDTSTQTADQLREISPKVKDEATVTSPPSRSTRESDISTRLLQLLERQLNQRGFHELSDDDKEKRKRGKKVKHVDEKVSAKREVEESLTVMYPSSESLSSSSEVEVFDIPTRRITNEEQTKKDSTVSCKDLQSNIVSSDSTLTDEITHYKTVAEEKRKLVEELEAQKQVKFDSDATLTTDERLAQSSGSSSTADKNAEKPKRLIDTMPPPVLSCRGFLGSSINQSGTSMNDTQDSLKPTQEHVTPTVSGHLPTRQGFMATQLPPLPVPVQKRLVTNEEPHVGMKHQGMSMEQPIPPSGGISDRLVGSDHQRHGQITPIEVPTTSESNNITAQGMSPLAIGVLPSRRSMQLAPLEPHVGTASSTTSLQSSGNLNLGRPSRFGQLTPLSSSQEEEKSKKRKEKKKKKNKTKTAEKIRKMDRNDQNMIRFPVQNISVPEERFMSARRQKEPDEPTRLPLRRVHAPTPPHHLIHPGRTQLQPISRQPNLPDVRRKAFASSAHTSLTGLRRGKKGETPTIAQNVAMLRANKKAPEKKGFLEPILPREPLGRKVEDNEKDEEIFYDPRVFPIHGFVPPELMEEYVECPIPEELLYREQLGHGHHLPGISAHHGLPSMGTYHDANQMAQMAAHYQLAEEMSEMEDPGLILVDDDELGLETVLALPPTRQKFWDSDFRC